MAAEIADIPRRRRTTARDFGHDVDQRHERKLHPAERLRLVEAKQPGLVQQLLVLAREHARVFGGLRALAQDRHDVARTAHRFVVGNGREIAPRLRQRADERGLRYLHALTGLISSELMTPSMTKSP